MSEEDSGLIPVGDRELFLATTAKGFEPGHVVFGRFVLQRILGRGGMGVVWLAHDNQLEQEVAIKVLPDVVMHDREAVVDMKRETKRSLQLNHHNIVRIYDFNQDEKAAGISMEFVDGETLSSAKAERAQGCFDVEEAGPWLEQICEALAYAHNTAKIVHRDLKPANIMLSKSNVIKVTDFGIARSISDSVSRVSMRHASSGTMVYMSPQQSAGARSSSSDDIYALGATIYDLLTGKPPFYSGNIQHQLESITPPPMAVRRAELERHGTPIPEAWEKAVAACLEKEASKRPASVHDLAQRLNLRLSTRFVRPPALPVTATAPPPEQITAVASPTLPSLPLPSLPLPPLPVPSLPRKPFLPPGLITPARIKIVALSAGGGVGLAALTALIMWVIGQGSLEVTTLPAGATVTLGGESLPSPAVFNKVWSGKRTVEVTLAGYDPVKIPAQVVKNKLNELEIINLTRSTGSAVIHSIPEQADCTLKLLESPVAGEASSPGVHLSGTTPWKISALVTGKYEVVTTADGYADVTDDIEIASGKALPIVVDVVKENALHSLPPDEVAAVNADEPIPSALTQDETGKATLTAYYQQTFQGYLRSDEFKRAEDQLQPLSDDFKVTTTSQEQQLDQAQKEWLDKATGKVNELLAEYRFASAETFLDDMDARAVQPSTAGLRDALAKAKTAHDPATEKTLSDIAALSNAGKSQDAYEQAVSAAADDSEEPRLLQEVATLELPMPSTYERVSNRFKSMDALLSLDSTLSQNAEFVRLYGIFQTNLNRHNEYRARLAAMESEVGEFNSRIGDLRAEQEHNERKASGYRALSLFGLAGGIAGAVENNGAGTAAGLGATVVGANGASARENDVQRLQDQIAEIESQRQPAEDQLTEVRKEYEALQQTPIDAVQ
jgi:serine/threonine protein kinase